LAPCMLLADLEIVFDILELTALKIHYLKRRSELEANMNYMADEMDLLGFYLLTGFNIGEAEFSNNRFQLTGMSKNIDDYYTSLDNDIPATSPNRSSLRGGGISAPSSKRKSFINGQMPPISSLAFHSPNK
jgi:hypothetical protein